MPDHDPTEVDQPQTVREKELAIQVDELQRRIKELEGRNDFGLTWEKRPENVELQLVREIPVLDEVPNLNIDGAIPSMRPHILIEGDNLHALHVLQATHAEKVKLISIDPPYNTGKGFIYNDRIVEMEDTYRHSKWLSFMESRLHLSKRLLKQDGVVFINIDHHELPRLWMLCERIFGEENVEVMIWHKVSDTGSAGQGKMKITHRFRNDSEFVLVAYRNKKLTQFNKPLRLKTFKNEYPNPDNDERGPWVSSEICKSEEKSLPHGKNYYDVSLPSGKKISRQWHVSKEEFERLDSENRIYWGNGKTIPRLKKFVNEPHPTTPTSLITGISQTDGINDLKAILGPNKFDNPKPVSLLRHLIEVSCDPEAIILDFFAGSGTTMQAVLETNASDGGNRQCILVTNNESDICSDVTRPRIEALMTGKWATGEHDPLPGSLRYFRTDFIARRKNLDTMRTDIAKHTVDLVAVKESTASRKKLSDGLSLLGGEGKSVAVLTEFFPDHSAARELAESATRKGDERVAYVFTWSDHGVEEETLAAWDGWQVAPLPAQLLSALRRTAPTDELPLEFGGEQS